MSFLIAEFVLVMQFLWKYIDDITGKGISLLEILELVLYFAGTIVPKAIPITILLSSVFVFGNMSEKFELTSLKSAGISLTRIMRVGFIFAILTAILSLYASNYLVPKANYEFFSRFDVIKKQKPALSLEQGVFNKDFSGYNIYVRKKHKDGRTVEGIIIYDEKNTSHRDINIVSAERGEMHTSEDGKFFIMNLFDGEQYRKSTSGNNTDNKTPYTFIRTKFNHWEKVFPLNEFDVNNGIFYAQRRKYNLMNTFQLLNAIDSVNINIENKKLDNYNNFNDILIDRTASDSIAEREMKKDSSIVLTTNAAIKKDTSLAAKKKEIALTKINKAKAEHKSRAPKKKVVNSRIPKQKPRAEWEETLHSTFMAEYQTDLVASALVTVRRQKDHHVNNANRLREERFKKERIILTLNQMYSWSFICILFLFIGAPLGSIIRKGGYGYPLLSAIMFFMIFIILGIIGDKLHRSEVFGPEVAAWLPCLALAPIAVFLTYKALRDEKLFNMNWFAKLSQRFANPSNT